MSHAAGSRGIMSPVFERVVDDAVRAGIEVAERGGPDRLLRAGMRAAIGRRLAAERARGDEERRQWLEAWSNGPVALVPEEANRQHYEVPASFFELILGPRLKYSAGLWEPDDDLAASELRMLDRTIDQAGVADGMRVLDLGCGWGSVSLRVAERFPSATVLAVSNSASQGEFIAARASAAGLGKVEHRVVDVNGLHRAGLTADGRFDRIISVEMLEHVRNHRRLFGRLRDLSTDDGRVYVHVFAHRDRFYPFEDEGSANWMTHYFFSGGVMPSADLFPRITAEYETGLVVEGTWWYPGHHYARTLDAWLERIDADRNRIEAVLGPVYGPDTKRWIQRWRMFMMACSELFGFDGGTEWGVVHHRMAPS